MSKKSKKYEVSSPNGGSVVIHATDSRDAKRKAAAIFRKDYGMDYKDSALTVVCMEGQPAKTPITKQKAATKESAPTQKIPTINEVVGWALYYVNKGVEWLNGQK